jgi:DNA polymerase-3 subunit delta
MKKHYMETIEKLILQSDFKLMNKVVLEGKVSTSSIIDNCETMPVFSDKRMVIVKNSGLFKSSKKDTDESTKAKGKTKSKGNIDTLSEALSGLPEHVCLIFLESEIDKRLKIINTIKQNGLSVEFALLKPYELVNWIIKGARTYNKELSQAAASWLVDNSEFHMSDLRSELDKAVLYTGDKKNIDLKDVQAISIKSIKTRIFDLTDAVAEKDPAKALVTFNDMLVLKEPIPKIIFMITRHIRQVLQIKILTKKGLNRNDAAVKAGLTPYAAGKIYSQAANLTEIELKNAMKQCLETDSAIKTGKMDEKMAAELLILNFCRK